MCSTDGPRGGKRADERKSGCDVRLTEEQYLTLTDPARVVNLFNSRSSPLRTSTRKARLFCCAVCRRVWDWLGPDANRAAVEAAERAADGLIRVKDLRPFFEATKAVPVPLRQSPNAQANAAGFAAFPTPGRPRPSPAAPPGRWAATTARLTLRRSSPPFRRNSPPSAICCATCWATPSAAPPGR